MRTQIILGRKHGATKFDVLAGVEIGLAEQSKLVRELLVEQSKGTHKELAEVQVWASESGLARTLRFRSNSEQKKHDAQRQKDETAHKQHLASLKPKPEAEAKPEAAPAPVAPAPESEPTTP